MQSIIRILISDQTGLAVSDVGEVREVAALHKPKRSTSSKLTSVLLMVPKLIVLIADRIFVETH